MITEELKNKMIEEGRIVLKPLDAFAHYSAIYAFGTLNILMIILAWDQTPPNPTGATMNNEDIVIWTAIDIFLLTAFYLIQRGRLKLKKETIDLDDYQILDVINEVGQKFDWFPTIVSKDIIQADSITILGAGNRITILIRDKDVYINCRTRKGEIGGFFRQEKITETFLASLRMRGYEVKHQKERLEKQASH
jgi:hypothetical protein